MIDAKSDAGEGIPANENSPKKPEVAPATIVALAAHYGQTPSTRRWTCTCRPSSAHVALGDYHMKERYLEQCEARYRGLAAGGPVNGQ
jgi:hypothetical protein